MPQENKIANGYVLGVDGGGSKTIAALADLKGNILKTSRGSSCHPRNFGLKVAVNNLCQTIFKVLPKKGKIYSSFLGLPAMEEEFKFKKEIIKKEILKHQEVSPIFGSKMLIGSDQLVGFRTGTNQKEGVMLNAGSGSVCHGWTKGKEVKTCGWGYLSETGSGFFIGQRGFQALWKELDGRGPKTLITKLIFQKTRAKTKEDLIFEVYSQNPAKIITSFSTLVGQAAQKKDRVARKILTEIGQELVLSAQTVIKKLDFSKKEFPLVFIGSVFDSKFLLSFVKKEIKKVAPKAQFIRSKTELVVGAVRLALENGD